MRPGCIGCSGSPRPSRRAGCTPRRQQWRSCPRLEEIEVEIDPNRRQDRCLPLDRARRPVGQHHRLRGPADPPPDRSGGHLPGREEPAPEQGEGDADPSGSALSARSGAPARPSWQVPGAHRWAAGSARRRSAPTTTRSNRVTDHRIGLTTETARPGAGRETSTSWWMRWRPRTWPLSSAASPDPPHAPPPWLKSPRRGWQRPCAPCCPRTWSIVPRGRHGSSTPPSPAASRSFRSAPSR